MKRSITNKLNDISFHDSNIENVERFDKTMIITLDWAKVIYQNTSLVTGKCFLRFDNVSDEFISPPEFNLNCIGKQFRLIATNESNTDSDIVIGGFYDTKENYSWVDWKCEFESFKLEWEADVTVEEWLLGKLPRTETENR